MPNLTCKYENEVLVAYRDYDFDIRKLGRERKLLCRECNGFVHLKKGKLKIAHFAHLPNQQILNCSKLNESIEHLECKNHIAKLLESRYSKSNVFPEHRIESRQEADIYLELPTGKFAIEIQFSQQTQEKWEYRTDLYKRYGIIPVWILGFHKELKDGIVHDFSIPQTMHNAGIELPTIKDWERYVEQTPFVREYQRNKTHIFHFVIFNNKKINLYVAYLGKIQDSKTLWFGEIVPIGLNWEFLEKDFRFMPEKEKTNNLNYLEEQKQKHEINAEIQRENDAYQDKLNSEQGSRWELRNKLLQWLKISHTAEIPELMLQYKEHKIERVFTIKIRPNPNEIPDRLIAEIVVYYKFIKTKPIGFEFSYAKDVEPFLREWKFCSDENKQYAAAQISSGFLAKLKKIGVLEKSPKNGNWKVLRKLLSDRG